MTLQKIVAAALISVAATPIMAQELVGSVEGAVSTFTDSDVDRTVTSLSGGGEIGVGSAFALGGNLAFSDASDDDTSVFNVTAHGMYLVSPSAAVGIFVGADSGDDLDVMTYGIEYGSTFATSQFGAYFGAVESDDLDGDEDVTIFGLNAEFAVTPAISVGVDYNAFSISAGSDVDVTFNDASLLARYTFSEGTSVFAQIGQISTSGNIEGETFAGSEEAEYISIGAAYKIGRNGGGNIFGERSFLGFGG